VENIRFHQQLLLLEQAELGWLDQVLYPKTILASGAGGAQRTSQVLTAELQRKAMRQKAAACLAWNQYSKGGGPFPECTTFVPYFF